MAQGSARELHAKFAACSYCKCKCEHSEALDVSLGAGRVFVGLRIASWSATNHTGYPAWLSYNGQYRNKTGWTGWSESLGGVSDRRIEWAQGKLTPENPKAGDVVLFKAEYRVDERIDVQFMINSQSWHDGSGACHQLESEHWVTVSPDELIVPAAAPRSGPNSGPSSADSRTTGGAHSATAAAASLAPDFARPDRVVTTGSWGVFAPQPASMTLRGRQFARYFLQHPSSGGPTEVHYLLRGAARQFTAWIGIDQSMNPNDAILSGASVRVKAQADGRVIWSSGPVTLASDPIAVDLDLRGVQELILIVDDGGDGFGHDWLIWADPVLR